MHVRETDVVEDEKEPESSSVDDEAEEREEHARVAQDALFNWCAAAGCMVYEFDSPSDAKSVRQEFRDFFEGAREQPVLPEEGDLAGLADLDVEQLLGKLKVGDSMTTSIRNLARVLRKQREFECSSTEDLRELLATEHHAAAWDAFRPFVTKNEGDSEGGQSEDTRRSEFIDELEVVCQAVSPEMDGLATRIIDNLGAKSWKDLAECSRWQVLEEVKGVDRAVVDKLLCIATMIAHESLYRTLRKIFDGFTSLERDLDWLSIIRKLHAGGENEWQAVGKCDNATALYIWLTKRGVFVKKSSAQKIFEQMMGRENPDVPNANVGDVQYTVSPVRRGRGGPAKRGKPNVNCKIIPNSTGFAIRPLDRLMTEGPQALPGVGFVAAQDWQKNSKHFKVFLYDLSF
jgi:hypothetical protein